MRCLPAWRRPCGIHIDLVRDGECQDVIKILKLWKHRHGIPLPSLVLELATGQALFNNRQASLEDRVWKVLGWLRDSFATANANSNNICIERHLSIR
jgi:hypothetical protein